MSSSEHAACLPFSSRNGHVGFPPHILCDFRSSLLHSHEIGGCALKILVPNQSAGTIIGKAGLTINQIQTESGSRVKLSQTGFVKRGF